MKKLMKTVLFGGALLTWVGLISWLVLGDKFERTIKEKHSEIIGNAASKFIAKNASAPSSKSSVKTVAALHHIEVKVDRFKENIFRASGVANSYLVQTSEGIVLFDTGLATQAAKHKRLLQEAAEGEVSYIILSHSHADHIGATKFWKAEFPNAKIITHRRFTDGQRYLSELQDHFWNRNRLLYTFMPETPPEPDSVFAYGGIEADILIDDYRDYTFTLGGVEFNVMATPGAEGDDNIVLWMPQQKALFSGDFFGPLFPMMPNLFTLRGEKFRDPTAYVKSLNAVLALQPEIVLPSHFDPIIEKLKIDQDIRLMRDATDYVHQQTIAGMNQGKSLWQLMADIKLPEHLAISQGHGKVSWNVRSIWEYYSTWFHFESTTELYPVPVTQLYPDIGIMAGGAEAILALANKKLDDKQYEQTLHLIEIALATAPESKAALELRLKSLEMMLDRAWQTGSNFSETGWLESRINITKAVLAN